MHQLNLQGSHISLGFKVVTIFVPFSLVEGTGDSTDFLCDS